MPIQEEKTTFFAGILNVIPSSRDLGEYLAASPAVASGCVVARDPLVKKRSNAKGVPVKITTSAISSSIDLPINLYQTTQGDTWQGSVYVATNTPTSTSMKIEISVTDYSGTVLQSAQHTINILGTSPGSTTDLSPWTRRTFSFTNTTPNPPAHSTTDDGNPNQIRIKIINPPVNPIQIWLDDLRLNREETIISIFKSSTTLDGDHPLRDPFTNYENIYFDSRFDYFNIPEGSASFVTNLVVNLGNRPTRRIRRRKKPGRTRKKRWVDIPISGYSKTHILTHNLGKIPIVIAYDVGSIGAYFGGTTIIQKEDSGGANSFRTAWISADQDKLYLNERWYTYKSTLSPLTLTLNAYIFNEPAKVVTGGPVPIVYDPGQPFVLGTDIGNIYAIKDPTVSTDTWFAGLTGIVVEETPDIYYINNIVSLYNLNGIYYAYHMEPDAPVMIGSTEYDSQYWDGWYSENRARGWNALDIEDPSVYPMQNAILVPQAGNTTNCLGISLSTNPPAKVEVIDDDDNTVGFGFVKAIPYKIYKSNDKGKTWICSATLSSPALHEHGAGGAGIACSPSGTAVAVASMIGGEQVEKVDLVGSWERFDNENFTPKTVTVTFSAPEISGGVTATGEPIIDKFQKLVGISMINRGSGYIEPPIVTITDTDLTPVLGTVTVTAANTRTVAATYDGLGNLLTPEQKFWKVGSATASGTNWLHKRTTTITFSNGATADLTFVNGSVTAIAITNQGSEIGPSASAPTITATLADTDNGTEVIGTAVAILTNGRGKQPSAAYSTDFGLNWIASTLPTIDYGGLCDVVYDAAGGFIAVGHNNLIMKSSDGSSWTDVSPSAFDKQVHWQKVIYAKSHYFCCGFNNATSYIIKSSNGSSWSQVYSIAGTYIHSMAANTAGGTIFAAGGEVNIAKPKFSGPNVVYSGEACWLKVTGLRAGTNYTVTGSGDAAGYTFTAAANDKGELLLGNLASGFTLGTNDASKSYTYSISVGTLPILSHTVKYVLAVTNSVYTAPVSNSLDYTNTTGYPIERTGKQYLISKFEELFKLSRGRVFNSADGNSWSTLFNGAIPYAHHIISSEVNLL